jgi:hypothetical protein
MYQHALYYDNSIGETKFEEVKILRLQMEKKI